MSHPPTRRSTSMPPEAPSTRSIQIGRRELFAWADRYLSARSLRDMKDLIDGRIVCQLLGVVFPSYSIKPASPHTHSPSQCAAHNWGAIQRGFRALGIPQRLAQRALLEAHDESHSFCVLVLFYFLHHVSMEANFTAEFAMDLSSDLQEFLQSFDSIRCLVIGGAISESSLPPNIRTELRRRNDEPSTVNSSINTLSSAEDSPPRRHPNDTSGGGAHYQNTTTNTTTTSSSSGNVSKRGDMPPPLPPNGLGHHRGRSPSVGEGGPSLLTGGQSVDVNRALERANAQVDALRDHYEGDSRRKADEISKLKEQGAVMLETVAILRKDLNEANSKACDSERELVASRAQVERLQREVRRLETARTQSPQRADAGGDSTTARLLEELATERMRTQFLRSLSTSRDPSTEIVSPGRPPVRVEDVLSPVSRTVGSESSPFRQRGGVASVEDLLPSSEVLLRHKGSGGDTYVFNAEEAAQDVVRLLTQLRGLQLQPHHQPSTRRLFDEDSSAHEGAEIVDRIKGKMWVLVSTYATLATRLDGTRSVVHQLLKDRTDLLDLVKQQQHELDVSERDSLKQAAKQAALEGNIERLEALVEELSAHNHTAKRSPSRAGSVSASEDQQRHKMELLRVLRGCEKYEDEIGRLTDREGLWKGLCGLLRKLARLANSSADSGHSHELDELTAQLEDEAAGIVDRLQQTSDTDGRGGVLTQAYQDQADEVIELQSAVEELTDELHRAQTRVTTSLSTLDHERGLRANGERLLSTLEEDHTRACAALRDKVQSLLDDNCKLEMQLRNTRQSLSEARTSVATSRSPPPPSERARSPSTETKWSGGLASTSTATVHTTTAPAVTIPVVSAPEPSFTDAPRSYHQAPGRGIHKEKVSVPPFTLASPSPENNTRHLGEREGSVSVGYTANPSHRSSWRSPEEASKVAANSGSIGNASYAVPPPLSPEDGSSTPSKHSYHAFLMKGFGSPSPQARRPL